MLAAKDQRNERVLRRACGVEFFQRLAGEPAALVDVHAEQLHFAVREVDDVGDARNVDDAHDAVDHVRLRMDDQVDAKLVLVSNATPVFKLVTANPSHLDLDVVEGLRDDAGENVDLV